ncbi:MAG: YgiQ family radical SAM protein [Candidatus Eremiobacteraeota bacterium]|nr:YgiQ family radical SAM protein [Candidatus Eremiobacteraeota bacterium]
MHRPIKGAPRSPRPFLPATREEMDALGWDQLDVLIVTGDAYVDHPSFGPAVIARVLEAEGLRVGVLPQPDWRSRDAFTVMGLPRLFCGISAGNLDSMLAHYTAEKHKRHDDDYTEGGTAGKRPHRATTVYSQCVRAAFPGTPVVIGGIEASMRRTVHYDYWDDRLRPSILADSKADLLVYGMGEQAVREVARRCAGGSHDFSGIRGTARLLGAREGRDYSLEALCLLPSWEECRADMRKLLELTKAVEREQNPWCGRRLVQFHGERPLVVEPPQPPLSPEELDRIYELPFTGRPHPLHKGEIPAYTMVKDSVTVVRGCAGGCSFCSLGFHQGRLLTSRTLPSVKREVTRLAEQPGFRGTISDLGGPTANLYGCANGISKKCRTCRRGSCLYPFICSNFAVDGAKALGLYRSIGAMPQVKHLFISSGIRMDVALRCPPYVRELCRHHVPGHLKVAPEHLHPSVTARMRKPRAEVFHEFCGLFEKESRKAGKEQYIVPYFIAGFPGCGEEEMKAVRDFLKARKWNLRQVQSFIPLPMTPAAAMFFTGLDYATGKPVAVIKGTGPRERQKTMLTGRRRRQGTEREPQGKSAPGRKAGSGKK